MRVLFRKLVVINNNSDTTNIALNCELLLNIELAPSMEDEDEDVAVVFFLVRIYASIVFRAELYE